MKHRPPIRKILLSDLPAVGTLEKAKLDARITYMRVNAQTRGAGELREVLSVLEGLAKQFVGVAPETVEVLGPLRAYIENERNELRDLLADEVPKKGRKSIDPERAAGFILLDWWSKNHGEPTRSRPNRKIARDEEGGAVMVRSAAGNWLREHLWCIGRNISDSAADTIIRDYRKKRPR